MLGLLPETHQLFFPVPQCIASYEPCSVAQIACDKLIKSSVQLPTYLCEMFTINIQKGKFYLSKCHNSQILMCGLTKKGGTNITGHVN